MILNGKVALVTGASRGMGAAIAKALSDQGAGVIINYFKNKQKAEEVVKDIRKKGSDALIIQADVRDRSSVNHMVEKALEYFSRIDILVNNAHTPFSSKEFLKLSWEDYQGQIEGTLKAAFNCCQAVLPAMKEHRYGKIINIISTAIDIPESGFHTRNTAKAGLIGFSRCLAYECAPWGITVNMVSPGWTLTDQAAAFPAEQKEKARKKTPQGRLATPEDIAKVVVFYSSDLSGFVTGTYLPVCGGYVMQDGTNLNSLKDIFSFQLDNWQLNAVVALK